MDGTRVDAHLLSVLDLVRPGVGVPAILETRAASRTLAREVESLGARVSYVAQYVPQLHVTLGDGVLARLVRSGVASSVWYDRPVYAHDERALSGFLGSVGPLALSTTATILGLDDSAAFVGSSDLLAKQDATGKGVKVAVLDTGADASHPMLQGAVKEVASFVSDAPGGDPHGHGTWVASAVAGRPVEYQGRVSGKRGATLRGMAPEASLLVGKVLTSEGAGALSLVIKGVEWAVSKGADIVSMSLGSLLGEGGLGPDASAVDAAAARGVRCVVAAGNSTLYGSIGSPGSAAGAVTVGSVSMRRPAPGVASTFSSRGPTSVGRLKPDLVAPGGQAWPGVGLTEGILGASSGRMAQQSGEAFAVEVGTSMATPTVAGVLAQLVPLGLPSDRGKLESVFASGCRRGAPSSLASRVPRAKSNRVGWGIVDGPRFLDAMHRDLPGLPVRNLVGRARGLSVGPVRRVAASALSRLAERAHASEAPGSAGEVRFTLV